MSVFAQRLQSAVSRAGRKLARFRGRPLADYLERSIDGLHRAINNVDFDMTQNGELRVLQLMSLLDPKCIFDVGANVGEWSLLAARLFPSAQIHSFEIVPSTFSELSSNAAVLPNVAVNSFGLSDQAGDVTIFTGRYGSTDATAFKIEGLTLHEELYVNEIRGSAQRAEDYIGRMGIDDIDFVKIDVEGMDLRVIKGFGDTIRNVRAIQFEYGIFNISSHDLLSDFCHYLQTAGFIVGKVFPETVVFFDYNFNMENFHGSNYIAVRGNEKPLIEALQTR